MASNYKFREYHPVLFALLKFKRMPIMTLAKNCGLSRPYVMKILSDPKVANGYDRDLFSDALNITTRLLDDIITGNIRPETSFGELYILQENLKAEAAQK